MKRISFYNFYNRKIRKPFKSIFKKNIPPEKLAMAFTLGVTFGIIPFYGLITFVVTAIALSMKLNVVAVNIAHYLVHPIQIALFIPFFKMGKIFYGNEIIPSSFKEFTVMIKADFWGTIQNFSLAMLSAIGIWLIVSIPLAIALFYTFKFLIRKKYTLKTVPVK